MSRVEVALGDRSYPVHIESGLIEHAGEMLAPLGGKRVVISDESVWALQGAGIEYDSIVFNAPDDGWIAAAEGGQLALGGAAARQPQERRRQSFLGQ